MLPISDIWGEWRMKSYIMLFTETEDQLGRKLAECEVDFLEWMHERYENENKQAK